MIDRLPQRDRTRGGDGERENEGRVKMETGRRGGKKKKKSVLSFGWFVCATNEKGPRN